MVEYFLYRVLEYLNFGGNVHTTSWSITLLRNQDEQGWEIDRGAARIFSSKQTATHSNMREKTQSVKADST